VGLTLLGDPTGSWGPCPGRCCCALPEFVSLSLQGTELCFLQKLCLNHRIIELLRLEKTLKIIKSNCNLTKAGESARSHALMIGLDYVSALSNLKDCMIL